MTGTWVCRRPSRRRGDSLNWPWAFARVVLSDGGHYAVASFRYLDVAAYRAIETPEGIRCARLEMLALSNLPRNPVIRPERIQTPVGPGPKRSNKDLGRVLAIARLAGREVVAEWPAACAEALRGLHASQWMTPDEFRAVAERLVVDAIDPLGEAARRAAEGT